MNVRQRSHKNNTVAWSGELVGVEPRNDNNPAVPKVMCSPSGATLAPNKGPLSLEKEFDYVCVQAPICHALMAQLYIND